MMCYIELANAMLRPCKPWAVYASSGGQCCRMPSSAPCDLATMLPCFFIGDGSTVLNWHLPCRHQEQLHISTADTAHWHASC